MDNEQYYKKKYLKYKLKYVALKQQQEGGSIMSKIASVSQSVQKAFTSPKYIFYVDGMEAHLRSRKLYGKRNNEFNDIIFEKKIIKQIKDESSKQKKHS